MSAKPIIKTGICSYGMSGKLFHAPFIHAHPGFELTAIVERTRNEAGSRYPNAKTLRSVEDLMADPELRLIVVNTPVQTHYDFAKLALAAGKNVVVEKPFVVYAKKGQELADIASERNLLLSVYQNRRYDGDYLAVQEVIRTGQLGDLCEVEMRFDRFRPGFSGKDHKEGSAPGAGSLYDLGAHLVDQALQLFGWPAAVFADIFAMRANAQSDDYFELILYYSRMRVRLKSSTLARESPWAFILHGTKGSFLQERSDLQENELLAGKIPSLESWCSRPEKTDGFIHSEIDGRVIRRETISIPGNYMGYYQDLYKSLVEGAPNPVPAADGVQVIRIIEAAIRSEELKSVVDL